MPPRRQQPRGQEYRCRAPSSPPFSCCQHTTAVPGRINRPCAWLRLAAHLGADGRARRSVAVADRPRQRALRVSMGRTSGAGPRPRRRPPTAAVRNACRPGPARAGPPDRAVTTGDRVRPPCDPKAVQPGTARQGPRDQLRTGRPEARDDPARPVARSPLAGRDALPGISWRPGWPGRRPHPAARTAVPPRGSEGRGCRRGCR